MKKLLFLIPLLFISRAVADNRTTQEPHLILPLTGYQDYKRSWNDKYNENFMMISATMSGISNTLNYINSGGLPTQFWSGGGGGWATPNGGGGSVAQSTAVAYITLKYTLQVEAPFWKMDSFVAGESTITIKRARYFSIIPYVNTDHSAPVTTVLSVAVATTASADPANSEFYTPIHSSSFPITMGQEYGDWVVPDAITTVYPRQHLVLGQTEGLNEIDTLYGVQLEVTGLGYGIKDPTPLGGVALGLYDGSGYVGAVSSITLIGGTLAFENSMATFTVTGGGDQSSWAGGIATSPISANGYGLFDVGNSTMVSGGRIYISSTNMTATSYAGLFMFTDSSQSKPTLNLKMSPANKSFDFDIGNVDSAMQVTSAYTLVNGRFASGLGSAGSGASYGTNLSHYTNTGMFFPAWNTVGFTTSGSEKVRISTEGYVGIGTTNPSGTLDVNGTINAQSTITVRSGSLMIGGTYYVDILHPEKLSVDAGTMTGTDFQNVGMFRGNANNYVQVAVYNSSRGANASSDFTAQNDALGYINIGINSSTFTTRYNVGGASDTYVYSLSGSTLNIGNASPNSSIKFFVGKTTVDQCTQMTISTFAVTITSGLNVLGTAVISSPTIVGNMRMQTNQYLNWGTFNTGLRGTATTFQFDAAGTSKLSFGGTDWTYAGSLIASSNGSVSSPALYYTGSAGAAGMWFDSTLPAVQFAVKSKTPFIVTNTSVTLKDCALYVSSITRTVVPYAMPNYAVMWSSFTPTSNQTEMFVMNSASVTTQLTGNFKTSSATVTGNFQLPKLTSVQILKTTPTATGWIYYDSTLNVTVISTGTSRCTDWSKMTVTPY